MRKYMVDITLPGELSVEFISMIPAQRAMIVDLLNKGLISNYSLTLDRRKLWAIFNTESEKTLLDLLGTFPLIEWMEFDIHELAIHQEANTGLPEFSLN